MHAQLGKILDKGHKKIKIIIKIITKQTQLPLLKSFQNTMLGAKTPPKRLAKHLCHPSGPTSRHTLSLISYKESALPLLGG